MTLLAASALPEGTLVTERLLLLPLSSELLTRSLEGKAFSAYGASFDPGWAGEAAAIFPLHLRTLHPSDLPLGEASVRGSFAVVERRTRQAIGLTGTKHSPRQGQVEIGYGLTPAGRGHGYATEAVSALLDHLRGWPNVRTVLAQTLLTNRASIRVLQKNGFVQTGQRASPEGDLLSWAFEL